METSGTLAEPARPPGIRPLPVLGGHLALDFANTVDDPLGPERWDHVADYPALLYWAVQRDLASPRLHALAAARPAEADEVVRRAVQLRSALNDTFGAVVDGAPLDEPWTRLRPFCVEALAHMNVAADVRAEWDPTLLAAPLWAVADAAHLLLRSGDDLRHLKRCAGCPWLFLDRSRNGSRRWCAMGDCGTHEKIRRYVTKRAQRRTSSAQTERP
jgi:predicted RNA-binding Zn ribbon-like protein